MPNTRPFLLFAFLLVGFLLWQAWQQDYGPKSVPSATTTASTAKPDAQSSSNAAGEVPKPATSTNASAPAPTVETKADVAAQTIDVRTDLLHVVIDTRGANVVRADLLAYPVDPKDKNTPVRLLNDDAAHFFVAQSGLVSGNAAAPDHKAVYTAEQTEYVLGAGADNVEVPFTWQDASGVKVRKVYNFRRGSYVIESRFALDNQSASAWTGNAYRQLQRLPPVVAGGSSFGFSNPEKYAFAGAAWYSPQDKFQKLAFDKFTGSPLNHAATGGWIAMLQYYFFAAWIPPGDEADQYSTATILDGTDTHYLIRSVSPALTIAPGETKSIAANLYVGPKLESSLDGVAPGLSLTADYGMLTVIAEPLHWVLVKLHSFVGNWGVAIILLVVLIKLVLFKLSEAQFRSMAKMKRLQPRMQSIKERYGDDKAKLNAATLELYQKEKINPMGGCVPLLVQIPVFFALLWVLQGSIELRQAPFFGWIQNLTAPDPYFILPVLNAIPMILTQWLSPAPTMDPMQAKMMKAMPFIFSVMLAFAPAGLVLYWSVNGWLSLLQQWVINKRMQVADKPR
jgi:YidC/Oxa1 family membrane protein insertase